MSFSRTPRHPHLVVPGSGLANELYWLRQEVATAFESGIGGGLTFTNYFPADPTRGVYTDWHEFMAAVATVPLGTSPTFNIATPGAPFVVPSAGMPVGGWDFRGGVARSFYRATGAVALDLPAGVKFDNLFGIDNGLVLTIAPAAGTGVLEWTGLPPQALRLFTVGDGCYVRNNGAGALIRSSGTEPGGQTHVLVAFSSGFVVADPPLPAGAKLVHLSADGGQNSDGIVLVQGQSALGGLPTDCVENSGSSNVAIVIYDTCANPLTGDMALWQPNFTGTVVFSFAISNAQNLPYTPTVPPDWAGSPTTLPTTTAIDRMAAALAGLLGGPIP